MKTSYPEIQSEDLEISSLSRRKFILQSAQGGFLMLLPFQFQSFKRVQKMTNNKQFDVIIVGGSYSGFAAGMALGRALRKVIIIDSGKPCNMQTPFSHNFLTQDGIPPGEIANIASQQLSIYTTVCSIKGNAIKGLKTNTGFQIHTESGEVFESRKLIFASGIKDIMPEIPGLADCWGISVLHCPYCHGYEVREQVTGILANGDRGFELGSLISNWTKKLSLFTNGKSNLTQDQTAKLIKHNIAIVETEIEKLDHQNGYLENIVFKGGASVPVKAIYTHLPFKQGSSIPENLGCQLNDKGYIIVDPSLKTSVNGIYACGDNSSPMRTVANAVSMGTTVGIMVNKEIILEDF